MLRPGFGAALAGRVTQTAAVAVAKALWGLGVEARIKWPNDLLVGGAGGRKICGILAESSVENVPVAVKRVSPGGNARLDFIVLGVGLNANFDPEDAGVPDAQVATLRSELGRDVDLVELLGAILTSLEAELPRIEEDFSGVLDDWRALGCTLGERVRVRRFGEILEGLAADISSEGALILRTEKGAVELYEGEVERLRQPGR